MEDVEGPITELRERLRRYPAGGYPVQHATAQFHLGVLLADRGDLAGAEAALATAARLFPPRALAAEHGKALNALGSVLRMAGRQEEAAQVLQHAAAAFEAAGLPAERGAACFNLGLVHRDAEDLPAAMAALEQARAAFELAHAPAHAAAAVREVGTAWFTAGDLDRARRLLEPAVAAAARAGDQAGSGTAANVLGLVELAAGRPEEAVRWFASAAVAHPRSVRPGDHAMALANLALAREAAGDRVRARVEARQAVGIPAAAPPVRAQAEALLARLGGEPDVMEVIALEEGDHRAGVVREELARWLDAEEAERRAGAAAWFEGQRARPGSAADLAAAWLAGLLELPPADMETVLRSLVAVVGERDPDVRARFRAEVARASARFHVPQMLRLRDTLNRIAVEMGEEPAWR